MKKNEKIILILGLSLSIIGIGDFNAIYAMEQKCTISTEMKELQQSIFDAIDPIISDRYHPLRPSYLLDLSGFHTKALLEEVSGQDFFEKVERQPVHIIFTLALLIRFYQRKIEVFIENLGPAEPDTYLSATEEKPYHILMDILPKFQKLLNLLQNACNLTKEQRLRLEEGLSDIFNVNNWPSNLIDKYF